MKKSIHHLNCILALLALLYVEIAQPQNLLGENPDLFFAQTLPKELIPLKNEIDTVLQYASRTDLSQHRWQQARSATQTQQQKWYPTLSVQGGLSRDGSDTDVGKSTTASQFRYGVTARQNLFSGGTDAKKQEILSSREQISKLEYLSAQRNFVKLWLKELQQFQYHRELVKFSEEAQQQAHQLNQLAQRKESSGFLGKRELLESEREVIRTQRDLQSNRDKLAEVNMRHSRSFGITDLNIIKKNQIQSLLKYSDQFLQAEAGVVTEKTLLQSLPWAIARMESHLAQQDLELAQGGRFSPRIDASAQLSENRNWGSQSAQSQTVATDRSRSWSVSLSGEIVLNPPITFGALAESAAKLEAVKTEQERVRQELETTLALSLQQLKQLTQQRQSVARLVAATTNLRQQNQRLFEAGEIPLDKLILSQQELDRDKRALVSIESEENALRIELALSELWNIPPSRNTNTIIP